MEKEIEARIGISLTYNRKKRNKKKQPQTRKEIQKARYDRLTNIKQSEAPEQGALKKKVLSKRSLEKIAVAQNARSERKHLERFGSNFNY